MASMRQLGKKAIFNASDCPAGFGDGTALKALASQPALKFIPYQTNARDPQFYST